jgi:hypothetical protein
MTDPAIDLARKLGEANVRRVCEQVQANEPERATIAQLEALVRHGYKFIDLHVRKDGVERHFEADWLARLFRQDPPA